MLRTRTIASAVVAGLVLTVAPMEQGAARTVTSHAGATAPASTDERFTFRLGKAGAAIWGESALPPTRFFAEFLPTYFTRELLLDAPPPAGVTLEWVFTGPQGGVTVSLDGSTVRLRQRYYNSRGLVPADQPPQRYPAATWKEDERQLARPPRSLTLAVENMTVLVKADGAELFRQPILIDLSRHQLRAKVANERAGDPVDMTLAVRRPAAMPVTVSVAPGDRHQTMFGFGGIVSFPAFAQMDRRAQDAWLARLQEDNLLVQREYPTGSQLRPDLSNFAVLADALPHYYGDNFPNGETSDFDFSRRIRALGGKVMFEFWRFPDWIQNPTTKAIDVDAYVRAMVGYCREAKRRTGAPPEIVGVQNEIIQNGADWSRMIAALRRGLDAAGFAAVRIHMPDAVFLKTGIDSARTLRRNPATWAEIDYSAVHFYDYQDHFGDPRAMEPQFDEWRRLTAGKPFLATELAINDARWQTTGSYRSAFAQALLYHALLTRLDASMLAYCWLLLDIEQPTFGDTRSLYTIDRTRGFAAAAGTQRRAIAAFSRRLPAGIVRVGATSSDPDLLVSAYRTPRGGRTLILLNRSPVPKLVQPPAGSTRFRTLERTNAYRDTEVTTAPPASMILIEPGDIVTLSDVPLRSQAGPT